jgi:hypothetical protein
MLAWIRCFTNPLNMTHVLWNVHDKNIMEAYAKQKRNITDCLRQAPKKRVLAPLNQFQPKTKCTNI